MSIAIYVRVSTQRQAQTQTIDQQLDRLRAVAAERGWPVPDEHVFRDDGYSGSSLRRPGLDRLRDLAGLAQARPHPDHRPRPAGPQLRPSGAPAGGTPAARLPGRVHRPAAVGRPARPAPAADPRGGGRVRAHADRRADPARPAAQAPVRADAARGPGRRTATGPTRTGPATRRGCGRSRPRRQSWPRCSPGMPTMGGRCWGWSAHLHALGVPSPSGKQFWGLASVRGHPVESDVYRARSTPTAPAAARRASAARQRTRSADRRTSRCRYPPEQWIAVATIPAIVTREQFDRVQAKIAANRSFAGRNNTATKYLLRALVSCGACRLACQARRTMPTGKTYYICTGKNYQVRQRTGYDLPLAASSRRPRSTTWCGPISPTCCDTRTTSPPPSAAPREAAGYPRNCKPGASNLRRGRSNLAEQIERLTEAYLSGVVSLAEYQRRRAELERRDAALAPPGRAARSGRRAGRRRRPGW